MASTGTRSSAWRPALAPSRQTTRATITWSPRRTSTCAPLAICRPVWIISPRGRDVQDARIAPRRAMAQPRGQRDPPPMLSCIWIRGVSRSAHRAQRVARHGIRRLKHWSEKDMIAASAPRWRRRADRASRTECKVQRLPRPRPHPPLLPTGRHSVPMPDAPCSMLLQQSWKRAPMPSSKRWRASSARPTLGSLQRDARRRNGTPAAALTTQITGEVIPSDKPGLLSLALREPVGVILGIAPWNAPVILGCRAIAAPSCLRQYGDPQGF